MQLDLESYNGFITTTKLDRFTQETNFPCGVDGAPTNTIENLGPRSNYCLQAYGPSNGPKFLERVVVPGDNVCNRGFRWKFYTGTFSDLSVDENTGFGDLRNNVLMQVRKSSVVQCYLRILTNGKIEAVRGNCNTGIGAGAAVSLGPASALALSTTASHNIRAKFTIHPSAGAIRVVVDGVEWLNLTGINTAQQGSASWDSWATASPCANFNSNIVRWLISDEYVADGVSGDGWNDIMPAIRVNPYYPLAEGDFTDGSPSPVVNRNLNVDEGSQTGGIGPDGDTTHNVLANAGDQDSFTHDPVTGTILGVQVKGYIRKQSDGDALIKLGLRRGGVSNLGIQQGPTSTYKYLVENFGYDPQTAAAWVTANFNAAQIIHRKDA